VKRILFALLLTISTAQASELSTGHYGVVGVSWRQGAVNAAVGYNAFSNEHTAVAAELEYIDLGEQPHTVTRNKLVNLDLVIRAKLTDKLIGLAKIGVTSSYFSEPYNDYKHDKDFKGHNIGLGLEYPITKNLFVQGFVSSIVYQECSQDKMNEYLATSIGLRYSL